MHQAKPYGLFTHGDELTARDVNFIDGCVKRVNNFKSMSNLSSYKYTRELPDGGFVIIQDIGGVLRAIAYKDTPPDEQKINGDGLAPGYVPMLFSGVIDQGVVQSGRGIEIKATDMCQRRLGGYINKVAISNGLQRFRCEYAPSLKFLFIPKALQNLPEDGIMFTQYHLHKASWHSGAMAEVVQIVGGYGRLEFDRLPQDPIEQAQYQLPIKVQAQIEQELDQIRLPGYTGIPDKKGRIMYESLFNRTNIVTFDSQNKPWLVLVKSDGVWAMPLPVIPATRSQVFHDYVAEMGDHELEKILDRFGAMPSGENFPAAADFYRWVRAGVIVRVCDSSNFFQHSPYSTALGWSCNSDGTRLINTCYEMKGSLYWGYTFQIELSLQAAEHQGWLSKREVTYNNDQDNRTVSNYLSQLFADLDTEQHDDKRASIKYKLRRVEPDNLLNQAGQGYRNSDIEYWDNYECNPIAAHTGKVVMTNQGWLYGGTSLKFPEPAFDGCISMDFYPKVAPGETVKMPKLDTIVFAYYEGDDLKVVKNFHDERKEIKEVEGNFEENEEDMVVGNWQQTKYIGLTGLSGELYSTDFDHRQEIAPSIVHTNIEGRDCGYGQPYYTFGSYWFTEGRLMRWRYYSHKVNTRIENTKTISEAFVIPMCNRNAVLYAEKERNAGETLTEELTVGSVLDPYVYEIWTYDWANHYIFGSMVRRATPFPADGSPVWAEYVTYSNDGSVRSDFADSGDWVGALPADVTKWVMPPSSVWGGGEPPNVLTYKEESTKPAQMKYALHLGMTKRPRLIHNNEHDDKYYTLSPDAYGNVLFVDSCRVMFGEIEYGNISVNVRADQRFFAGYSKLCNHSTAHTFIGVINE